MSIRHHLDPATILRYASGDLETAFAVAVATHLTQCNDCASAVHLAETIGGALLEAEISGTTTGETGTGKTGENFNRLMTRIDEAPSDPMISSTGDDIPTGDIPLPLARHIGPCLDAVRWRRIAPGIRQRRIDLSSNTGSSLFLLHAVSGASIPEHGHGGAEMTVVLEGSYRDVFGHFAAGDVADLDEHAEHTPIVDSDEACICLIATETEARFHGLAGRLAQRFFGI